MDISSIYVKNANPNEIAIVTKFTTKVAKNLLEDVFGVVAEPHGGKFYKLMYSKSSLWYCRGIPLIALDNITWCKKICIMVDLKQHRIKIEDDNRIIDSILVNYEKLENVIANACHNDILIFKKNVLKLDDYYSADPKSTLYGVRAYIRTNGTLTPEHQHNEWMTFKINDGWKYGEVKDYAYKTHPCLVPYEDLPVDEKAKDYIFIMAIERELEKYKRFIEALNKD